LEAYLGACASVLLGLVVVACDLLVLHSSIYTPLAGCRFFNQLCCPPIKKEHETSGNKQKSQREER
jgi:hypothetical protein